MKNIFTFFYILTTLFGLSQNNKVKPSNNSKNHLKTISKNGDKYGGLMLMTVREEMKENPKKTLKEVADIGYAYVEVAGYENGKFYGMEPKEFREYLKSIGLEPKGSHHFDIKMEELDQILDDCNEVGFEYIVLMLPPLGFYEVDFPNVTIKLSDDIEGISREVNKIAERANAKGLGCLYHAHDVEYMANTKGIVPLEYLIEHSQKDHLDFVLDLYWVARARENHINWIKKAPGRFKVWHLKDIDDEDRFTPVGLGNIDFKTILKEEKLSGMKYYYVEQDFTYGQDPMEVIKLSHKNIKEFNIQP